MASKQRLVRPLVEALESRVLLSASQAFDAASLVAASDLLANATASTTLSSALNGLTLDSARRYRLAPVLDAATAAHQQLPLPTANDQPTHYFLDLIRGLQLDAGPSVLPVPTVPTDPGPINHAPSIDQPATAASANVAGTSTTLSVTASDADGDALTYTWALASGPAGVDFAVNGTQEASQTTVTFYQAGYYTFQASAFDGSDLAFSSVGVNVVQTLTGLTIDPAAASTGLNGTVAIATHAVDQFGRAMQSLPPIVWSASLGSVSGGSFHAGTTAGTAALTATAGTLEAQATIDVINHAPNIVSAPTATMLSSTTLGLSALADDDGGAGQLHYTWSAESMPTGGTVGFASNGTNAASSQTLTLNRAGTWSFQLTVSDGTLSTSAHVSITVAATLTSLDLTPATITLDQGTTQQFTPAARDQFGQTIASPTLSWTLTAGSVGTISGSGLYTASASGSATVHATAGGLTASAWVTIASGPPVAVTTRHLYSFDELVITGTNAADVVLVTQSGTTFTIASNGQTQTITGTFGDLVIHGGDGDDQLTIDSSVTINTLMYGDAGSDTLIDHGTGAYNAIISIGGGTDDLTGNGYTTNFWADTADTVHAGGSETTDGYVHQISGFYQPWSSDPANADYVSTELAGQSLRDPTGSGGTTQLSNRSLFGAGAAMEDVNQGQAGDCYFLAALEGVAHGEAWRVMQGAVDLGDGTYAVRLKISGSWLTVRVDGDFYGSGSYLRYAKPGATGDLWAPVFEKAYAYVRSGANSYSSLDYGGITEGLRTFGLSTTTFYYSSSGMTLYLNLRDALAAGHAITIGTGSTIYGGAPLIAGHAYALISVSMDANGNLSLTFRNPWGIDGTGNDGNTSDGLVTITSTQLRQNYLSLYATTA